MAHVSFVLSNVVIISLGEEGAERFVGRELMSMFCGFMIYYSCSRCQRRVRSLIVVIPGDVSLLS